MDKINTQAKENLQGVRVVKSLIKKDKRLINLIKHLTI